MLGMLSVGSELERDIIREQMLENRIARAKRGIPTNGEKPTRRIFNKETREWKIDQQIAKSLQWAAEEYLKGESLQELAHILKIQYKLSLGYENLKKTLAERCADTWTINFKGKEPIEFKIPRILPNELINRVRERLAFNRRNNRTDIKNKYLLTGFIRCDNCQKGLSGQTIKSKSKNSKTEWRYYNHTRKMYGDCKAFSQVNADVLEKAVMQTIFENIANVPSFEKAISESLPDKIKVDHLKETIKEQESQLRKIDKDLDKLVDLALSGTLNKETIRTKEKELIEAKNNIEEKLNKNNGDLRSLPDVEQVKKQANEIRLSLLERFSGQDRLNKMSFDEKGQLLHWLFDGKDHDGVPYGIYINKRGKRQNPKIDYYIYGRITGLRTIKGNDVDYH